MWQAQVQVSVLCEGWRSAMTHLQLWEMACDADASLLRCMMLTWHAELWKNPVNVAEMGLRWREADSGASNDLGGVRRRAEVVYQPAKAVESRQTGGEAAWRWSGDHCTGEGREQSVQCMCMLVHRIEYDRDTCPGARWIVAERQPIQLSAGSRRRHGSSDEFVEVFDH